MLKDNRLQVIEVMMRRLGKKGASWTLAELETELRQWEGLHRDERDGKSKYWPCCGVVIYYLKKRIKRMKP